AHARPSQTVAMMDVVVAVTSFHAQAHAIDGGARVGGDANDPAVFHIEIEPAADAAVRASRRHDLVRQAQANGHLVVQRAGRAVGYAGAARFTARVEQGSSRARGDGRVGAASGHAPDESGLHLAARAHTARAHDALAQIDP